MGAKVGAVIATARLAFQETSSRSSSMKRSIYPGGFLLPGRGKRPIDSSNLLRVHVAVGG